MSEPVPYTREQMRAIVLTHVWALIDYWEKEQRQPEVRQKLSGLAFSILTMIDGGSGALPAFELVPSPHKSDRDFARKNGLSHCWPNGEDIAGELHSELQRHERDWSVSDFDAMLIADERQRRIDALLDETREANAKAEAWEDRAFKAEDERDEARRRMCDPRAGRSESKEAGDAK